MSATFMEVYCDSGCDSKGNYSEGLPNKIQPSSQRLCHQSLCWLSSRLQILLCQLHEKIYGTYRGVGKFS